MLAAALASDRARPLEREVQKMRLVKSRRELRLMKDAADLSADAHAKVCLKVDRDVIGADTDCRS